MSDSTTSNGINVQDFHLPRLVRWRVIIRQVVKGGSILRKYFSDSGGDVLKNNDCTTMGDDLVIASSIRFLPSVRLYDYIVYIAYFITSVR